MDQLREIENGTVYTLPGAKVVASVFDLEYAAYPDPYTETVELEAGTVLFSGLELTLVPDEGAPVLLLNLNGLDKTHQLARTINEASIENADESSAVLEWIEDRILDYENDKYGETDYKIMREEDAGCRAYHDSIDA